jgi:hypothetical protein
MHGDLIFFGRPYFIRRPGGLDYVAVGGYSTAGCGSLKLTNVQGTSWPGRYSDGSILHLPGLASPLNGIVAPVDRVVNVPRWSTWCQRMRIAPSLVPSQNDARRGQQQDDVWEANAYETASAEPSPGATAAIFRRTSAAVRGLAAKFKAEHSRGGVVC